MSNEEKILSLLDKMYVDINKRFDNLETRFGGLETQVGGLETQVGIIEKELASVKSTVIKIENNHGEKLSSLFDGYKQHTDQLERIEKEVSKHEEVILRRIR